MLHSTFWHHGANDLNISSWYLALLQQTNHGDLSSRGGADAMDASGPVSGAPLDFLYPPKTMAFIRRISTPGRRRKSLYHIPATDRTYSRQFSTRSPLSSEYELESRVASGPRKSSAPTTVFIAPDDIDDLELLEKLLPLTETMQPMRVWALYQRLGDDRRSVDLKHKMMEYLHQAEGELHQDRLLEVFDSIPKSMRSSSAYLWVIQSQLSQRPSQLSIERERLASAVELHNEALANGLQGDVGSSLVFAKALAVKAWPTAVQVYELFWQYRGVEDIYSRPDNLWAKIESIDDLLEQVMAYCDHLTSMSRKDKVPPPMLRLAYILAKRTVLSYTERPDGIGKLHRLFFFLRTRRLGSHRLPLVTLKRRLKHHGIQRSEVGPLSLELRLYLTLRKQSKLHLSRTSFVQMLKLLGKLQPQQINTRDLDMVEDDFRKIHGRPHMAMLLVLTQIYAAAGDESRVQKYFSEYCSNYVAGAFTQRDAAILGQFVYLYARRGDLKNAVYHFEQIRQKHGLQPNLSTWNYLIHAYQRADDLDSTYATLQSLLDAGQTPNQYSLGPIIHTAARRGNVEHVQDLLDFAKANKVQITSAMAAGLVVAHVHNNDLEMAEYTAGLITESAAEENITGKLTLVWNPLLTTYAFQRSLDGVLKVLRRMLANDIPRDHLSYAAFQLILCKVHQANKSRHIVLEMMPAQGVQPAAINYAIAMAGLVSTREYDAAVQVYDKLKKSKVRPSLFTELAYQQARAMQEVARAKDDGPNRLSQALRKVQGNIKQAISQLDSAAAAAHEPQSSFPAIGGSNTDVAMFYEFLVDLCGTNGAFDLAIELYHDYEETGKPAPLGLLSAVMQNQYATRRFADVERSFNLATQKSLAEIGLPANYLSMDDAPVPSQKFSVYQAKMLSEALNTYVKSLGEEGRYSELSTIMRKLLQVGFTLDYRTWNTYIRILLEGPNPIEGFAYCEAHLMTRWRGWRKGPPVPNEYNKPSTRAWGFEYMKKYRKYRPGTYGPMYKTLIALGRVALVKMKEGELGQDFLRKVQEVAPRTMAAIRKMPRVEDYQQEMILRRGMREVEGGFMNRFSYVRY
jgi:pentatricopeptide repeat-containing protein PET309